MSVNKPEEGWWIRLFWIVCWCEIFWFFKLILIFFLLQVSFEFCNVVFCPEMGSLASFVISRAQATIGQQPLEKKDVWNNFATKQIFKAKASLDAKRQFFWVSQWCRIWAPCPSHNWAPTARSHVEKKDVQNIFAARQIFLKLWLIP